MAERVLRGKQKMIREKSDPVWSATVRWVFGFIKFQLRCGQTLEEIEVALTRAVDSGELYSFVRTFDELKAAHLRKLNEAQNVARL